LHKKRNRSSNFGFTLIEIAVVILIIGLVYSLVFTRSSYATYFREEGFLRQLTETISFLHQRAEIDGKAYKLEFNFTESLTSNERGYWYRVREIPVRVVQNNNITSSTGILSRQLSQLITSDIDLESNGVEPQNFPSLKEKVFLPDTLTMTDIRLQGGVITEHSSEELPSIFFSPQGFSDFAVLHFENQAQAPITILVNPFSGICTIYKEFKDFEWTFGRQTAN
jgi:prepilin-type N-terminal cleavage/methylation domain-containing protein